MRVYESGKETRKEMNIVVKNSSDGVVISACDSKGNICAFLITIGSEGFFAHEHAKDDLVANGFDVSDTEFGNAGEIKFRGII